MFTNSNPFEPIYKRFDELQAQNEQILAIVKNSPSFSNQAKPVAEWMNIHQLREYLPGRPKQSTIYAWTHKGIVPFHKQNNKGLLFRRSEIDAWIEIGMKQESKNEGAL